MTRGRRIARLLLALIAAAVMVMIYLDWNSVERGNRLYRAGEVVRAEELYRAAADSANDLAEYNLGTALLARDIRAAEAELRDVAGGSDPAIAQRASYNLGYAYLARIDGSTQEDSVVILLQEAIARSRAAVRLEPADENARWNLALSQQMLDSIQAIRRVPSRLERPGRDTTDIEVAAMTRSGMGDGESGREPPNPQQAQNIGNRTGASSGAREAWASQDPGPLSEESARGLLTAAGNDPEALIRAMLWSMRPDVEWWAAESYPGGNW